MAVKETLESYVAKAKAVHGDRYRYVSYTAGETAKGTKAKITAICSTHGEFSQRAAAHLRGCGCAVCGYEKVSKDLTKSFEEWVQKAREVHGDFYEYKKIYVADGETVLNLVCPTHGEFTQRAAQHIKGQGCRLCGIGKQGAAKRQTTNEVLDRVKAVDSEKTILEVFHSPSGWRYRGVCEKHGEFVSDVGNYIYGTKHYCGKCGKVASGESKRLAKEEAIARCTEVHGNTYTYLDFENSSVYTGNASITACCKKHGKFKQNLHDHLRGCGCRFCGNLISKGNLKIAEHLENLGIPIELEKSFRDSQGRMDVDVYVPSKNLAIEFLGIYWHSSKFKESSRLLKRKTRLEALGVNFLAVYEDELNLRESQTLALIANRAGKSSETLHARKLKVAEVSLNAANKLLDAHHIQGGVRSGVCIGLLFGEELVSVAVFSYHTSVRKNIKRSSHVELTRFAGSVRVVGALGRLVSNFLKHRPEVHTIATYSDNRLFTGKIYKAVGFVKQHTTSPDYTYFEKNKRNHKSAYQKSRLVQRFPDIDASKTEKEITESLKLFRIYDCGKTKWLYSRK